MTDTATPTDADHDDMFAALCREVGFCLHAKGQTKVKAALASGLDAAVRAVFDAEGVDFASSTGDLRRAVRDCLKANLPIPQP
ncbi:hypothetical protein [Brevundimonas sp.]|uniref:hypothetical protein n=1 Tax=Brevundimonas sp. TaxID=1871086 RepID=UPI00356542D0